MKAKNWKIFSVIFFQYGSRKQLEIKPFYKTRIEGINRGAISASKFKADTTEFP